MPVTAVAIAAGSLSIDHLDLLAPARAEHEPHFQRNEELLVTECSKLLFHQAVRVVEYWKQRVDADGSATDAAHDAAQAHLHASTTLGGTVELDGTLEPIGGSIFLTELQRLERNVHRADKASGVVRTRSQRHAAALVEMAIRSAGTETVTRARPLFSVLVGDDTFARLCELSTGVVVTPDQIAPWLDAAWLETVLFDGPRTIVSVSHQRTFTGAVRRAVSVRDRYCQHPSGCETATPTPTATSPPTTSTTPNTAGTTIGNNAARQETTETTSRRDPRLRQLAVGVGRVDADHQAIVADHRPAVVVPVGVLTGEGAVVVDQFLDRVVVRRRRDRRQLGATLDHHPRPEVVARHVQRRPLVTPQVVRLGPPVGDRDADHPVGDSVTNVGQLRSPITLEGCQDAPASVGDEGEGTVEFHAPSNPRDRRGIPLRTVAEPRRPG